MCDRTFSSPHLRSVSWDAEALLCKNVLTPSILIKWQKSSIKGMILHDMRSERDSKYLSSAIHALSIDLSDDFLAFEQLWLRDELNHYIGFRYLFSLISEGAVGDEVENQSRVPDFSTLLPLLRDEFYLCLLLAYDELVTTRLYISEYPRYDEAGDPAISRWIRLVVRDEAYHFANVVKVAFARFPHRFHEVPTVVNLIIERELSMQSYGKTFVLDRAGYSLSHNFLLQCAQPLLTFAKKYAS